MFGGDWDALGEWLATGARIDSHVAGLLLFAGVREFVSSWTSSSPMC